MNKILLLIMLFFSSFIIVKPKYYAARFQTIEGKDQTRIAKWCLIKAKDLKDAQYITDAFIKSTEQHLNKECVNNPIVEEIVFERAFTIEDYPRRWYNK